MERMYTETEAKRLAIEAAKEALKEFASETHPPMCMTVREAAKALKVSVRTVARLNLKRNSVGKIPYSAVLEAARK